MKDSTQNRNDANGRPLGQGWDDPAFNWENMQDGIFGKIIEEDPDFFKEKRRRRLPIWFWFCAAIVAGSGLTYLVLNQEKSGQQESNQPIKTNMSSHPKKEEVAIGQAPTVTHSEPVQQKQIGRVLPKNAKAQTGRNQIISNHPAKNRILNENEDLAVTPSNSNTIETIDNQTVTPISFTQDTNSESSLELAIETPNLLVSRLGLKELRPFLVPTMAPVFQPSPVQVPAAAINKKPMEWTVTALGGTSLSFSKLRGSSSAVALRNDHSSPWFGYQNGLRLGANLGANSKLVFGLNRQVAFQNIDIYTERTVLDTVPAVYINYYVVGGRTNTVTKDTVVVGVEQNRLVHYNEMRSFQSYLAWSRPFEKNSWRLSPQVGVAIGYISNASGFTVAADGKIMAFGEAQPIFRKIQVATVLGLDLERKLSNRFSAILNYQVQQQWNNASLESGISYRPMYHNLSIGLQLRLGNSNK